MAYKRIKTRSFVETNIINTLKQAVLIDELFEKNIFILKLAFEVLLNEF